MCRGLDKTKFSRKNWNKALSSSKMPAPQLKMSVWMSSSSICSLNPTNGATNTFTTGVRPASLPYALIDSGLQISRTTFFKTRQDVRSPLCGSPVAKGSCIFTLRRPMGKRQAVATGLGRVRGSARRHSRLTSHKTHQTSTGTSVVHLTSGF